MKITEIETFTVGAGWKNWLFVKVHTDGGIHGIWRSDRIRAASTRSPSGCSTAFRWMAATSIAR